MIGYKTELILNPNADWGHAGKTVAELRSLAEELGEADWSETAYPTHAAELAQQAGEAGYGLVVAFGGDGTVHEVINGLMQVPPETRPRLRNRPFRFGK